MQTVLPFLGLISQQSSTAPAYDFNNGEKLYFLYLPILKIIKKGSCVAMVRKGSAWTIYSSTVRKI